MRKQRWCYILYCRGFYFIIFL